MKTITLTLLLLTIGLKGFATTWTITDSGFTFSPSTLTIALGDTVIFVIANIHTSLEVSQATWNANGNTPLAGGWALPFGGGMVLPEDLTLGTHFYVCQPHANMGMKGMIIVEETTSTDESPFPSNISVFPNPSTGKFQVAMSKDEFANNYTLEVYDVNGKKVFARSNSELEPVNEVDLSGFEAGTYFVKLYGDKKVYSRKIVIQ